MAPEPRSHRRRPNAVSKASPYLVRYTKRTRGERVSYYQIKWRDPQSAPYTADQSYRSTGFGPVDQTTEGLVRAFVDVLGPYTRRVGGKLDTAVRAALLEHAALVHAARELGDPDTVAQALASAHDAATRLADDAVGPEAVAS